METFYLEYTFIIEKEIEGIQFSFIMETLR